MKEKYKWYFPWVCNYCGRNGHIRPFCFKLHGYPKHFQKRSLVQEVVNVKKAWKPKGDVVGLIAHTSLRASFREDWYVDSGCSRHMTGKNKYLESVKSYKSSYVAFGNGAKGEILGIGKLTDCGLPKLDNVY